MRRDIELERHDRRLMKLIVDAQNGCRRSADELVREVEPHVSNVARRFFYPGADHEDIVQWGLMGVIAGIRTFRVDLHNRDVHGFLVFCAQRYIVTGLLTHRRQHQQHLNEAVSLATPIRQADYGYDAALLEDVLGGGELPDEAISRRDDLRHVVELVNERLTPTERAALLTVVNGDEYANRPDSKSVDNGVQRARRKLKLAMAA